jgi:diguanylate cyclase (GGDEF)-like protein/PAS domain S-box-containing protein
MSEPHSSFEYPASEIESPISWEPSLSFLKYAIASQLIGSLAVLVALRVLAPDQNLRTLASVLVFLTALVGWYLLRRGRIFATIYVLAYGVWTVVTVTAAFTGGVRAPSVIVYPVIILMIGWMISPKAALFATGLSLAATSGFLLAESRGYLPVPLPSPPALYGVVQVILAVLSLILIARFVSSYQNRIRELHGVSNDLAHRSQLLEATKVELNRAQAVGNVGSWIYDIADDTMRLSAETCRIFGLPEGTTGTYASYLGRTLAEDRSALELAWHVAQEKRAEFDHEHRIVAGKAIRWVRQKAEFEFAADGTVQRAVGVAQDITQRKQTEELLQASEMRFRSFVENANDVLFTLTPAGVFSYVSPQWEEAFGYERGETIGQPFSPFVHPGDVAGCLTFLQKVIETGKKQSGVEYRVRCKNGSYRWYTANGSLINDPVNGKPTFIGIGRDIDEHKQIEDALKNSEFRWKFAIEGSGDGVWDWNIQTDEAVYSIRWKEMLGYSETDILPTNQEWVTRIHPDDRSYVAGAMQAYLDGETSIYVVEYRLRCKDESYKWILGRGMVVKRSEDGKPLRMIGTHTDITERKQMEEQVRQMAFYDTLTKLPNRRLLNDRLSQAMAANKRSGFYGALMFLDLDNFKPLNDSHGHEAGDLLLIEVADRLISCVREMDTVARFGGDEFVVMVSELVVDEAASTAQAGVIAEKIRSALSAPYRLTLRQEGKADIPIYHRCTASIGVALFVDHDSRPDDILRWADSAMYEAKEAGRNLIRFYDEKD